MLVQAALTFTQMQYVQLHVTHGFIALITSGLEDRLLLSYKDYTVGINAGPCPLNMMDILFGDHLMYKKNTFGRFVLENVTELQLCDKSKVTTVM